MKPERHPIRFRVVCRPTPPESYHGKPTGFGARHKEAGLVPAKPGGKAGTAAFTFEAEWAFNAKTGRPKFYGPFVFDGGADQQSLYLRWETSGTPREVIAALKIHLETVDRTLAEKATRSGGVLETTADAPRWGVDKNWHGLGIGREWTLKAR